MLNSNTRKLMPSTRRACHLRTNVNPFPDRILPIKEILTFEMVLSGKCRFVIDRVGLVGD